ncbi:MAG TPA: PilZ domain-containing protein [Pyrinomonadaceae bacterium]|nr:PilZ domain-containing protein [Pyrinomonadaceae bacterium]
MIRKLIAVFNRLAAERRAAPRYDFQFPVKISIQPPCRNGKSQTPAETTFIYGETKDLSRSGIGFLVPSIRIRENYLVGESCTLNVEMHLPDEIIQMQVIGHRYEQIGEHLSVSRYLIGASISQMTQENREVYEQFLRCGGKSKAKTVSLEIEMDKAKESREVVEVG